MVKQTLRERFESKITRHGPVVREELGPCWDWTASLGNHGYGVLGLGGRTDGKDLAHRISWELSKGDIPEGVCVLHKCDRRSCVNPDHLFLGSKADNTADMVAKGRMTYAKVQTLALIEMRQFRVLGLDHQRNQQVVWDFKVAGPQDRVRGTVEGGSSPVFLVARVPIRG